MNFFTDLRIRCFEVHGTLSNNHSFLNHGLGDLDQLARECACTCTWTEGRGVCVVGWGWGWGGGALFTIVPVRFASHRFLVINTEVLISK